MERLVEELSAVLREPEAESDFVFGMAHFPAAGAEVMVNVDPELDDRDDVEPQALAARVAAFLALTPEQWDAVVGRTVAEIEDAAGEVTEPTALRDDLDLTSVVVFVDAALVSFVAPLQLPDALIRVQLDADFAFEDVEVEIEGLESLDFSSVDDLLDHLTQDGGPPAP